MKCTLELYGKSYESTEFTERQVTGFIAASCGVTGINIRDLFQSLINFKGLEGKGFRDYDSIESAERDLSYLLAKVFPTLDRHIDSIDTAELIEIVTPMLNALNVGPKSLAVIPTEPIASQGEETSAALALVRDHFNKQHPIADTVEASTSWEYPPDDLWVLSEEEEMAIDYASQISTDETTKIHCWYQWWRSVNEGDPVTPAVAIELIRDFTKQFTELECERYYALIEAHLSPRTVAA